MGFLFSSVFWGGILVLLGISVILKAVFQIDIPIFRVVIACILIYWGIKILFGVGGVRYHRDPKFDEIKSNARATEYNVVFGSKEIDLRNIELTDTDLRKEINVVFGSSDIIIDPKTTTVAKVSTVFGECVYPHGKSGFLGDYVYQTEKGENEQHKLFLEISVVFGTARILEK